LSAGGAGADGPRLVVAKIDADGEIGREADEPHVLGIIGGAGFAGDRLAHFLLEADAGGGAALHDAFHHRGDLIGGHRVEHLLAPVDQGRFRLVAPLVGVAAAAFALVVAIDGVAVAVLDAVDQRRLHPLAAVVEHRIGGDHAQQGGLAGAERKGEIRRQVVIHAETLGIVGDQRHADVLRQTHRHHVARMLDAEAQGRGAVEFAFVIFRPPGFLPRALVDLQRRVEHDRGRRIAVVERGGVDDGFE
jgi:hypothetical protein